MRKLVLQNPSQRIIGFTAPEKGRFLLCDHDEVFAVTIGDPCRVVPGDDDPYEISKRPGFVGWGWNNGEIRRIGETTFTYDFTPTAKAVVLKFMIGAESGELEFPIFSGDWFAATLSTDGRYLVLGEPYDIAVFEV